MSNLDLVLTPISYVEPIVYNIAYRGLLVGTIETRVEGHNLDVFELIVDEPGIVNREFLLLLSAALEEKAKERNLSQLRIEYLPKHLEMFKMAGFTDLSSEGEFVVVKQVSGNPDQEVKIVELEGNITAHISGVRATAELTRLGESGTAAFGLEPDTWFWFNRLINQSGEPNIGTLLLDKVLEYCREKDYSIANQVSAYGDISQKDLEDWYIRKGFTPVDYKKYGNAFLKWESR